VASPEQLGASASQAIPQLWVGLSQLTSEQLGGFPERN
jgi:hypothetical protein